MPNFLVISMFLSQHLMQTRKATVCALLRELIYQQLFSGGKALRCRLIKVKQNINTLQYFSESISQENQLIIKRSLCNYCHGTGAWKKLAMSSHFFYFSWRKPSFSMLATNLTWLNWSRSPCVQYQLFIHYQVGCMIIVPIGRWINKQK